MSAPGFSKLIERDQADRASRTRSSRWERRPSHAVGCQGTAVQARSHTRVDLTGTWRSDDYECPWGVKHSERVSVVDEGERIVATKITGDDCVPAGFETFSGRLPAGAPTAAITWTAGTPRAPASATRPGYLKILGRDEFRAGDEFSEFLFVREPS